MPDFAAPNGIRASTQVKSCAARADDVEDRGFPALPGSFGTRANPFVPRNRAGTRKEAVPGQRRMAAYLGSPRFVRRSSEAHEAQQHDGMQLHVARARRPCGCETRAIGPCYETEEEKKNRTFTEEKLSCKRFAHVRAVSRSSKF